MKVHSENLFEVAKEISRIQAEYSEVLDAEPEIWDGLQAAKKAAIKKYREVTGNEPVNMPRL